MPILSVHSLSRNVCDSMLSLSVCTLLTVPLYIVDGALFHGVMQSDIDKVSAKYQEQVPILCSRQMLSDYTLIQILAVGWPVVGHENQGQTRTVYGQRVALQDLEPLVGAAGDKIGKIIERHQALLILR